MRVYINRKPIEGPWGGGNMWVKSMYQLLPQFGIELVELDQKPDVILVAGLSAEDGRISAEQAVIYKQFASTTGRDVKVVLRVNENDARKGTNGIDERIRSLSEHMDVVVFVSKWMTEYFASEKWPIKTTYIHNGVDKDVFRPNSKIDNGKINIVTHHWSDNYMKGFDVYDAIDDWIGSNDDFTFTYIGRDRGSFKNSRVIKPLFGRELGEELGKYDVYISASRFDPGPNHIIESLACGIPTYVHKQGGGCIEFSGDDHAYDSIDELLNILKKKNYTENEMWKPTAWFDCVKRFAEVMKESHE